MSEAFERRFTNRPAVVGFFHRPAVPSGEGLVLAHGAGGDARGPLLVALAEELCRQGVTVLRLTLPFRQERPHGPPTRADEPRDREGLRAALDVVASLAPARLYLGGHSYAARQSTLLAAEDPDLCDALLLLAYPLHLPGRRDQQRTQHFPKLSTPALFVHGPRDPYGSLEDLRAALELIPTRTRLLEIAHAGHNLRGAESAAAIAAAFRDFLEQPVEVPVTDVLDLHSVSPREVKGVLEAWLEETRRRGFRALRIIHGRGIGVQREIVRSVLRRTPWVASFQDAPEDAGGWGATIVTLRD